MFRSTLVPCALWAAAACAGLPADRARADGLAVSNPAGLTVLAAAEPGQPVYPRVNGRITFGVNDNSLWKYSALGRSDLATSSEVGQIAKGVGASIVRLDMSWPSVQPFADEWRWNSTDDMYRGLISQGVRPLWMINSTPRFAVAPEDVDSCGGQGWGIANYCDAEPDAAHPEHLRTFGAEFARRYPLSAGFEYRNEPNLSPPPEAACDGNHRLDPVRLAGSLREFTIGVHSVRPELPVIGGALGGCDGNPGMGEYAGALLDALTALPAGANDQPPFIDAISVHPYDPSPDEHILPQILENLEMTLVAHGHPDMRVLVSELGVSSRQIPRQVDRSRRLQSYFETVNALRDGNRVDAIIAFNTIDTGDGFGWLNKRDLLGKFQALRPYCDFRTLLRVSSPLPSVVRNCLPASWFGLPARPGS